MTWNKKEILSVPNLLSFVRLLLIPLFVLLYLTAREEADYRMAALVVLVSGLTDFADGQIARRCHMITEFGKFLDPLADKLTQVAVVFCLAFRFRLMILLVLLVVVKELTMGICGLLLLRQGKKLNGAKWFGKLSTAVFYIVMFVLMVWPNLPLAAANVLIGLSGVFLALSFVLYVRVYIGMFRGEKRSS